MNLEALLRGPVRQFAVPHVVSAPGASNYAAVEITVPATVRALLLLGWNKITHNYGIRQYATTQIVSGSAISVAEFGGASPLCTVEEGHVTGSVPTTDAWWNTISATQDIFLPVPIVIPSGNFLVIAKDGANTATANARFLFAELVGA